FSIKWIALICMCILAVAFLISYLHLGVFITIALSPMLPTMVLVALSFLCAMAFCIHVIANKEFRFARNSMNLFVVFFAIALLWGCVNSFDVISSVSQVAVHLSFILFYFVVVNTIRTKTQWLALIKLFLLSSFVVALYGVLQNFVGVQGAESWLDEDMFEGIRVRVYSFFNNPNVLGEFLVYTIPLCAAMLWGKMNKAYKTLFGFILISMAACMIFTWSRGAWLGVFFACALFLVIMDKRWVFFGVLALLLLPLLMVLSGNTTILERLISIGNTADTSTAYRVSIWKASVNIIQDYWVSGIGVGSKAYGSVYPLYALSGANFALHSHNLYLQVLVEMGVIGIGALLSMIVAFVRQVFSDKVIGAHKTDVHAKLVIALGAGLLGFLLQGFTDYVWYNYKMLMIFWIFLALGISGVNLIEKPLCDEEGTAS
ncbi:MAG: O-antigen ligase family protein, partial [Clostridia bacterium]|nr:O-antigen ligase family protein [Clostridia bacterium]